METIYAKINELLQVSKEDLIGDKDFSTKFDAKMKRQNELMDELRVLARKNNTVLGRTVRFPMADSYALYLITSVGKSTVQLKWLNWCDAWVDDRCGYACKISLAYVQKQINFDDWWSDEAEKRNANKVTA
jgi:hypothetical protein